VSTGALSAASRVPAIGILRFGGERRLT